MTARGYIFWILGKYAIQFIPGLLQSVGPRQMNRHPDSLRWRKIFPTGRQSLGKRVGGLFDLVLGGQFVAELFVQIGLSLFVRRGLSGFQQLVDRLSRRIDN